LSLGLDKFRSIGIAQRSHFWEMLSMISFLLIKLTVNEESSQVSFATSISKLLSSYLQNLKNIYLSSD
jgi:hypothetical protein